GGSPLQAKVESITESTTRATVRDGLVELGSDVLNLLLKCIANAGLTLGGATAPRSDHGRRKKAAEMTRRRCVVARNRRMLAASPAVAARSRAWAERLVSRLRAVLSAWDPIHGDLSDSLPARGQLG